MNRAASPREKYNNKNNKEACKKGYADGHFAYYHKSDSDPAKKQAEAEKVGALLKAQHESEGGRCGNVKSGNSVKTKFNLGCLGNDGPNDMGAIEDLLYALLRFLSIGVGIALVISMIWAGLQYSSAEGNPETSQAAKSRIQNTFIGLMIYLFAFALIQYLVPGGAFTGIMVSPDMLTHSTPTNLMELTR